MAVLYLVPTPIGNLEDITFRAVRVLAEVDCIYAEDTRTSRILLQHYKITTPVKSYHQHNEKARSEEIIKQLLKGHSVAVISDAGSPGISDPSNVIVHKAISQGIAVCPLPGATAVIPALCASGFDTSMFYMAGFLPSAKKQCDVLLRQLSGFDVPIVVYEAPHRLQKTLSILLNHFGDADVSIAREISKVYETFYRGKLTTLFANFTDIVLKGEFVIVVIPEKSSVDYATQIAELYNTKYTQQTVTTAAKLIADELAISKNMVYETLLILKREKKP